MLYVNRLIQELGNLSLHYSNILLLVTGKLRAVGLEKRQYVVKIEIGKNINE